tara:strand:- start:6 stop:143 length:138 start_codon:yes stop_codon:yes gene_type:complete
MGFIFTTDELTAAQNIVSQLKELNQFKKTLPLLFNKLNKQKYSKN